MRFELWTHHYYSNIALTVQLLKHWILLQSALAAKPITKICYTICILLFLYFSFSSVSLFLYFFLPLFPPYPLHILVSFSHSLFMYPHIPIFLSPYISFPLTLVLFFFLSALFSLFFSFYNPLFFNQLVFLPSRSLFPLYPPPTPSSPKRNYEDEEKYSRCSRSLSSFCLLVLYQERQHNFFLHIKISQPTLPHPTSD